MTLAGARSSRDLGRARARASELSSQVAEAEARSAELERRIELLRDDPVTLERLAREELGLVRPHDVVVVLPPQWRDGELPAAPLADAERASSRVPDARDPLAEVP